MILPSQRNGVMVKAPHDDVASVGDEHVVGDRADE